MIRHLAAALAALSLAAGAQAAPRYAVLSLVGDKLDVVTYQLATGSQLDANSHEPVAMPQDEFDLTALHAIARALKATAPDAPVALLAASRPEDFAEQDHLFAGDHVTLPAEIDAAVRREGATQLVLVTKHRGTASMQFEDSKIGSGRVEGLGFYLDGEKRVKNHFTGKRSIGFIAPFVYVDVSLVDVATGALVRHTTITSSRAIGAYEGDTGAAAWDGLSASDKVALLNRLLDEQLTAAIPALLADAPR